MFSGIDHVNRYVSDVEKHISFYTEALGFSLLARGTKTNGSGYAILAGYGHELYISERPPGSGGEEDRFRHIGYRVADADAFLGRLKDAGIVAEETEMIVKEYSRQFYLYDPDGNEIDIIQWTDKERFYGDLNSGG